MRALLCKPITFTMGRYLPHLSVTLPNAFVNILYKLMRSLFCGKIQNQTTRIHTVLHSEKNKENSLSLDYIFILIIAVASISFKPGPGMAAIVARAIQFGFWSAFMVSMGAITIELLYFMLAYFSFSLIENNIGSISIFLKIIGSSYLLYLAFQTFQKSKKIETDKYFDHIKNKKSRQKNAYLKDYMVGIVVTLANPLVILFYTALIPTILDLSIINIKGLMTALCIIFSVHFIILTSQCLLALQVRTFLQNKVTVQKFNMISAIMLAGIAVFIFFGLIKAAIE